MEQRQALFGTQVAELIAEHKLDGYENRSNSFTQ